MTGDVRGIVGQIARIREGANLLIEDELRKRSIEGIQPAHGSVLVVLFQREEPIPIKEIVERVGRVKSTVTGMVNTLQRHGYLEKTSGVDDGRVVLVSLTEKGRSLRPHFEEISEKLLKRLYGKMPRPDRERIVELLSQLQENLGGA